MTAVSPMVSAPYQSAVPSLRASKPVALNSLEQFDWSKGAGKKNAARITVTNLPKVEPVVDLEVEFWRELASCESSFGADLSTKAQALVDSAGKNKSEVPELLAREARFLNTREFAELMKSVEETSQGWGQPAKFYVFTYKSGTVGSVWLDGQQVYNSIWKN
jgi:hypothetical protein